MDGESVTRILRQLFSFMSLNWLTEYSPTDGAHVVNEVGVYDRLAARVVIDLMALTPPEMMVFVLLRFLANEMLQWRIYSANTVRTIRSPELLVDTPNLPKGMNRWITSER